MVSAFTLASNPSMNPSPFASPGATRRHLLRQVFANRTGAALAGRLPAFRAPAPTKEGLNLMALGDEVRSGP